MNNNLQKKFPLSFLLGSQPVVGRHGTDVCFPGMVSVNSLLWDISYHFRCPIQVLFPATWRSTLHLREVFRANTFFLLTCLSLVSFCTCALNCTLECWMQFLNNLAEISGVLLFTLTHLIHMDGMKGGLLFVMIKVTITTSQ